jgi:hypothetical protein
MDLPWRLFAGILVLWLLVGVVPFLFWRDLHNAAEFASAFGFVNALFAALAFGGVIWAIRLQTKELELQRLEIEETRDELRRSADAQHQSQQMHFLAALLAARNNVAQGYAAAAEHETGSLRPSQLAHRQQLAELEWLLQLVDRHESNPFALPPPETIIAHQVDLLLRRTLPVLQPALAHRAANHARSILLELNQSLRELRRLLASGQNQACELGRILDRCIARAEAVSTASDFDEIAAACEQVCTHLSGAVAPAHDARGRAGGLNIDAKREA